MYTIKLTETQLQEVMRKAGNRGPAVRDFLIEHSDQAPPPIQEVVDDPVVPNAMGTYRDQSKSLRQPSINAAVEGADAPENPGE